MKVENGKRRMGNTERSTKFWKILPYATACYVLASQLRRAVVSVCSNLAEGSSGFSKLEKKRFYEISRSSLVEVDTQLEISLVLEYLQKTGIVKLESYLESVFKILSKTIGNLQ